MRGYSLRLALSDYLRSKPTCANFTKAHSNNHSTDTGLDISCIFCCFSRRHLLHYHEPLYISPTDPLARPDERDLETNKAQSASEPHPNHLELAASASPVQAAEHIPQGPPSLTSSPPQRHSRSASPTPPPRPPDLQYSFFSFSARVSRLGHPIPQHPELMSPSSSTSSSRKPEDLDAHVTGLRLARSVLAALEAELSARMSVAEAGRAVGYALNTQVPAMPGRYQFSVSHENQTEWLEQQRRAAVADEVRLQELRQLVATWRQRVMASEKILGRMTSG